MLTIYIYKNVPFQSSYDNVLYLTNDSAKMAYLNEFLEGTKENIQRFYSGENYIDLDIYYEDCNYMVIHDDRSARLYKYFYIEKCNFIAGGTIRYYINIDIWQTYHNSIIFYPSRMINGHVDAQQGHILGDGPTSIINFEQSGRKNIDIHKIILNTWDNVQNATLIAIGKTSAGNELFACKITNNAQLLRAIEELSKNQYAEITEEPIFVAFENLKTYLINDVDIITAVSQFSSQATAWRNIYMGVATETDEGHPQFYRYANNTARVIDEQIVWPDINIKVTLKSISMFEFETFASSIEKLKNKYTIGTLTNNQEIVITRRDNPTINLVYYQFKNNQCAFYLEYSTIMFNITNEFEIPFTNDSYTLYMAQNQATFETANKNNAIQLATQLATAGLSIGLAGATGGTSLMLGASAIASGVNIGMKQMQQQASIENAKRSIDRSDGMYTAGLLTFKNGLNIYKISYAFHEAIDNFVNNFGTSQLCFLTDYKAYNTALFNFNYVQFDDLQINGDFTNEIKIQIENIFKHGVRIWYDNYLLNVNYKK